MAGFFSVSWNSVHASHCCLGKHEERVWGVGSPHWDSLWPQILLQLQGCVCHVLAGQCLHGRGCVPWPDRSCFSLLQLLLSLRHCCSLGLFGRFALWVWAGQAQGWCCAHSQRCAMGSCKCFLSLLSGKLLTWLRGSRAISLSSWRHGGVYSVKKVQLTPRG